MSYTLNCNHRDVIPKKCPALDSYIIEVDKTLLKDDCENELHLKLQS